MRTNNSTSVAGLVACLLALPTIAAHADELRIQDVPGIWAMRGYGKVLDISAERVVRYDITDVSCVREGETPLAEAANEYDRYTRTPNGFTVFAAGGITRYEFERLGALPDRCRATADQPLKDPELNFSVLWHAFRENYGFFDLRHVRWDEVYARFRPQITAATTQEQLFEIFSQVLAALNDGHVGLLADGREYSSGKRGALFDAWAAEHAAITDRREASRQYRETVRAFVDDDVLKRKAHRGADGILTWGWAAAGVGYVHIEQMYLSPEDAQMPPLPEQIARVDKAMTRLIGDLQRAKALIVDARFNSGGHDAIALRIMGYLTTQRRLAFTKKAVAGSGHTQAQEIYFEPVGKRQFTGPLYYLQSDNTVSAAEIFSLAMMALPNVTRVGTPTYGVLSDVLEKKLPNGWSVGLSNELYVAIDGQLYEGRGIPPTVPVAADKARNFRERMQLDIETALGLIAGAPK